MTGNKARIWEKVVVVYTRMKVLSLHSPAETEEYHENILV
jgi:hypothetical protein